MTDTRQRAVDLVEAALAEQEYFSMDDLFDELETDVSELDFPDAWIMCERMSDELDFYRYDNAERRGSTDLGAHGMPEAMAAGFDERLRNLARNEVARHRKIPSERVKVFDPAVVLAPRREPLLPWNIHDPKQANVVRGLIAGVPQAIWIIRGRFSARDLLRDVYADSEHCGVGMSADCDGLAPPPTDSKHATWRQSVWGVFTVPVGEFLVYFTLCADCYNALFCADDSVTDFFTFDPKYDQPVSDE